MLGVGWCPGPRRKPWLAPVGRDLRWGRSRTARSVARGISHLSRALRDAAVRVSVFITCFNDTLFPRTGRAMVELLERLGHEVEFRPEQTCCGQMHMNSGYRDEGLELAARMRRVFDGAEGVVTPAGPCARPGLGPAPGFPVAEPSPVLTRLLRGEDRRARHPPPGAHHPPRHSPLG